MIKRFLLYFISISALPGLVFWLFYQSDIKSHEHLFEHQETTHVDLQSKTITSYLQKIESDLTMISSLLEFRQLAESHKDYSSKELEDDFLSISLRKGIYDQIRFIGKTGQEILRINYNKGKPILVPKDQLQNKIGRYYFKKIMNLNKEKVYVSPLDLNFEKGEVEKPFKPVIRFGSPIFNSQNEKKGVLILNFFAQFMIDSFKNNEQDSVGQTHLLNSDGYWLSSPNPEDEWGFMLEERKNKAFSDNFPVEWTTILKEETGQFSSRKGLFTFKTLYPIMETVKLKRALDNTQRVSVSGEKTFFWKIVSFVPQETLYQVLKEESKNLQNTFLMLYAFLASLIGAGAFLFVKAGEEKRKAEIIIKEEKDRAKQYFEVASVISVVLDSKEKVTLINKKGCEVLGCNKEEVIGKDWCENFLPKKTRKNAKTIFKMLIEGHFLKSVEYFESPVLTKEGKERMIAWHNAVIRNESGYIINALISGEDITEKIQLQKEFLRSAQLATIGELAAGVAHEVNNPITGIINYSQIITNESEPGSIQAEMSNRVIKEGRRIATIVKSLLSFSRGQDKKRSPCNVKRILSEVLDLIGSQLLKDGVQLKLEIPDNFPEIHANSNEMQQVFLDIINNALYALNQKYPKTDKNKTLDILGKETTLSGQLFLRINFYDSGTGVAGDILDKLMDPFFSTKPKGEGTGLGLSICSRIIKEHDGDMHIESKEGEFTRVIVDLPTASSRQKTGNRRERKEDRRRRSERSV